MQTSSAFSQTPLAVQCVRSLMERHGLPRYRQSAWLANAVGLSYSKAHRRLNGTSPWSLEDLAQLASLFGETLAELVTPPDMQPDASAVLRIGTETINCRLWLGDPVAAPTSGSVFAVKSRSGWVIATCDDRPAGDAFNITRLEAHPATDQRRIVAVLDADRDATESIVADLEALGYSAHPFYSAEELLKGAAKIPFDCFVLDWVVNGDTVLEAVRTLRVAHRACPIVILTALVSSGANDEIDIAEAMKRYDLLFCEKPVRIWILAAMLARALAPVQNVTDPLRR